MADVDDGYASYYAERLWLLLPAVYRTLDTDSFSAPGPLHELLDRIGAQVAVVRRSIDRLWADQSIETCDDWVIPYVGGLLGTNLVNGLDPQAQRVDVANTIHYRRRKGTLEVMEELAADITGWGAHVVEGFARLARTRHGLDPTVGPAAFPNASPAAATQLLRTEGLSGLLTGGPAGGFADLRAAHGASLAGTAFDESFHMADMRAGQGAVGHFGIPKLIVFLWRLRSFGVTAGTPVAVAGCDGLQYTFDPTGREVPLFLPSVAELSTDTADSWTSAHEWQIPGPLTSSLDAAINDPGTSLPPRAPYPDTGVPSRYSVDGATQGSVWPELGRFSTTAAPAGALTVDYQYGFSDMIGAGPYNRDLLGDPPGVVAPETAVTGGADALATALTDAPMTATVTAGDSLTYTSLADVGSDATPIVSLLVRAGPSDRPVLRPAAGAAPWVLTGGGPATVILDGLTVSGGDIILRGSFDTVRLTGCTMDPGTAADASPPLATAVDGRTLSPCRIFVEADPAAPDGGGAIRQLLVDHCILGPIRTRFGGSIETLSISDSIVQGLPASSGSDYTLDDVFDPSLLANGLTAVDPLSTALLAAMPAAAQTAVAAYQSQTLADQQQGVPQAVVDGLNSLVSGASLYNPDLFATVGLSPDVQALAARSAALDATDLADLNRGLLDEAFPVALGVAAIAVADATVALDRVSVLGRLAVHRLQSSDTILRDFSLVDDTQSGCVRFSAYVAGSVLPRQYESAAIVAGAPIFTSDAYGRPGYGQLLESADTAIVGGATGASIAAGAETGSEMGAFSAGLAPVKERGLVIKYAEYMPLGLTPVIVHVT